MFNRSSQSTVWSPMMMLAALLFLLPLNIQAQPSDLPWDPDPDCNSIVTTGIVSVTCGAVVNLPPNVTPYTFGMVDMNGALPAAGRIDVTNNQDMYHHPSWHVDSIGNVFGITLDNCGNVYTTASANYSSDFFGSEAIIRYGEIGGGAEDLNAAGTIYQISGETGQASVFAVLPQQATNVFNITCEGFGTVNRTTGPGLGNITFSYETFHFYATNFEDGRIYRLDTLGNILDSYDPINYDNGAAGPPDLEDVAYGVAINNTNTELFFGSCGVLFGGPQPAVYSIPLNADGSFVGTVDNTTLPAGATWDNFVGTETQHTIIDLSSTGGFATDTYYISDLEFAPNDNLLVAARAGCSASLYTSYNHGGQSSVWTEGGGGLYDVLDGIVFISDGTFAENNGYGGVTVFENPNGNIEYIYSCGDLLQESGPHGIMIIEEGVYGNNFAPASPAGAIAYIPDFIFQDPKGIGGDVVMFKECACELTCPLQVATPPLSVCSDEVFALNVQVQGGQSSTLDISWTDANGDPVPDPNNVSITHTDCAPGVYPFYFEALCQLDQTTTFLDTLEVTVVTDDLSPFLTIIEEPCMVDLLIENGCENFISIIGDIPTVMEGDTGTVVLEILQTTDPVCVAQTLELEYACPISCPPDIFTSALSVCSDEVFALVVNVSGGSADSLIGTWTDASGAVVPDPNNVSITHTDCAPGVYPFFYEAVCQNDQTITFNETLEVTVVTDDISPFLTIIEEPCMLDLLIETGCEDFISIIGEIPDVMVGDSGSVTVEVVQTTFPACVSENIELNFSCLCGFEQVSLIEEDCENGEFFVTLNFIGTNLGENFSIVDQDGNDLGTFSYLELPITLGPFVGDFTTEYTLFLEDADLPECAGGFAFGPTYCPPFGATWGSTPPDCEDDFGTINFLEIQGGTGPYTYSIDGGLSFSTGTVFEDLLPGVYQVVVQDGQGSLIEEEVVIPSIVPIVLSLQAEQELELGQSVQLNANVNLAPNEIASVQWSPAEGLSCTDCLNPIATPTTTTEYTVVITDLNGCTVEDRTVVVVNRIIALYIPNAFSPNGDGINDVFRLFPRQGSVEIVEKFQVYDRWGELVWEYTDFDPDDPAHSWDGYFRGELMNSQVFAYYAIVRFIDGTVVLYEGDVTLVL